MPFLSAHFILFYSLKSSANWKKCIISLFKRKKKVGRERSTSLSRFLQEQEQCGSPRSMLPTQTPPGMPPPPAAAGPGTNFCPAIKVARQKHTLGDTSPLSHADVWTSDGFGPVQIWKDVYSQGAPYQVFSWRKPLWFESPVQPCKQWKNATICPSKGCLTHPLPQEEKKED